MYESRISRSLAVEGNLSCYPANCHLLRPDVVQYRQMLVPPSSMLQICETLLNTIPNLETGDVEAPTLKEGSNVKVTFRTESLVLYT